jgi:flagellum-specific peptidoglycan hydrolase FlgJ
MFKMTLRILFISIFTLFLASCGSKKAVVTKKQQMVVVEPKPIKLPSVDQVKHIEKLESKKLNKNTLKYIKKYAPIAVQQMYASNIPASITLAQGILESGSGKSELALKSNNHFGIKCHREWRGESVSHDDDEKGECFRKYEFVATSYIDHSAFLTQRSRYAFLFNYNKKDYKKWAKGLRKAGYATDKKYPQKLIKLIETYKLYEFDAFKKRNFKLKNSDSEVEDVIDTYESKKNKGKTYIVEKGDTLYSISRRFKISVNNLKKINKLNSNSLAIGQILQIE